MPAGRLALILPLAIILAVVLWLWPGGGMDMIAVWAREGQRDAQNALARSLRALRQGEAGATFGLLSVCFLYGVFHAAGPGHGKVLIGGYGLGRPVAALRLAGLALAASLVQSLTAVLLVLAGVGVLQVSRTQVTGLADTTLNALSYVAIGLVGLWLALRGLRALWHSRHTHGHSHDHDHHHHGTATCAHCGHAHAPSAEQAAQVQSLRDALILIGAIAIRPCTGALFLLIIAWRMDLLTIGIAGAFAIGIGTAAITIGTALASVWVRRSSIERLQNALPDASRAAQVAALTELTAGALIALIALSLAARVI